MLATFCNDNEGHLSFVLRYWAHGGVKNLTKRQWHPDELSLFFTLWEQIASRGKKKRKKKKWIISLTQASWITWFLLLLWFYSSGTVSPEAHLKGVGVAGGGRSPIFSKERWGETLGGIYGCLCSNSRRAASYFKPTLLQSCPVFHTFSRLVNHPLLNKLQTLNCILPWQTARQAFFFFFYNLEGVPAPCLTSQKAVFLGLQPWLDKIVNGITLSTRQLMRRPVVLVLW